MIVARDFLGLLIPHADPITVSSGMHAELYQSRGNFATIYVAGKLIRVEAKDFDAIGLVAPANIIESYQIADHSVIDLVWLVLSNCYDPEISINIVDLGLIYSCDVIDQKVIVHMTLTSPTCAMGSILMADVKAQLLNIHAIKDVEVIMVFDPPWTTDRLSASAKLELGLI